MKRKVRAASAVLLAVSAWMAIAAPASAVAPAREPYGPASAGASVAGTYPAGGACRVAVFFEIVSGGTGQQVTFLDQSGNVVRVFNRVRPSTWVITNVETGESATVRVPA